MENETPQKFAKVSWSYKDVLEIRPDWTKEQAEDALGNIESELEDIMISRGWDFLEGMLPDTPED